MATVCVCDDGFVVVAGELCIAPGLQDLRDIVTYTTPGLFSFTKATYPWLARVKIRVQGAGGGSGGTAPTDPASIAVGSGGAAGAYAEIVVEAEDLAATERVFVGAGGTAGVAGAPGDRGQASFFGSLAIAGGGAGGAGGNSETGTTLAGRVAPGGTGDAGTILIPGGDGEPGWGRGTIEVRKAGSGGSSVFGGGRAGRGSGGNGNAGRIASGEGAGGAAAGASAAAGDGAAGAGGRVVVELYG